LTSSLKRVATDILLLLASMREKQQFPDGIDGPTLQKATKLTVDDINDAVSVLKDSGYVEIVLFMETRDFVFTTVKITPQGRFEAERVASPIADPIKVQSMTAPTPPVQGASMHVANELRELAAEMDKLRSKFVKGNSELFLRTEDEATFKRLYLESKAILDEEFSSPNQYSNSLHLTVRNKSGGFMGGPSLACVSESSEILRAAAKQLERKTRIASPSATAPSYVDLQRLNSLRAISGADFDPSRLVRLCEELNIANQNQCAMTVAILVRAITDHVPPVFGQRSFAEIVNNYSGAKSFKKSMQHLELSLRNIADAHLHLQIRATEALPNMTQVNFSSDLDVLLSETDRLLRDSV
jgi:hypothetical protein